MKAKLRDGEDALAAEFLALLRTHAAQQTEIILFQRLLTTAVTELAFFTVAVEDEVRGRCATSPAWSESGFPKPVGGASLAH